MKELSKALAFCMIGMTISFYVIFGMLATVWFLGIAQYYK